MAINTSIGFNTTNIDIIKDEFKNQFPEDDPPSSENEIAEAIANVLAKTIEIALTEVKDNADVVGVTSGSDTVTGGVD